MQVYELQVLSSGESEIFDQSYQKKIWMVLGEGFVFIGLLALSLWTLNKHQKRESQLARQEKNFVLAITHELKTPVATIRLFIDTILKRDLNKEKQIELLTDANKETLRLDQLVENMLLSSRLEQKKGGGFDQIIELSNLVSQTCQRLHKYLGVDHSMNLSVDDDVNIKGDSMSLESLVSNLYENAVKYGGPGVVVGVRLINKKSHCLLEIEDNGPGIPAGEMDKIFQKFYRVGNEETRSAKGTGIGLYMVKQIAQAHKGEVSVSSVLPQGVKFKVLLPYE